MKDLSPERTPDVIAAEINMIKHQTEKMVLQNFIEIGRRLKEAKDLLAYGEWGKWLAESVGFSVNRADKLMRVYDAYGTAQPAALTAGAPAQELSDLNYTQALILLAVPEEERAQFIAELDIENLSTRELQKAVDERQQAQAARERAERENADLRQALDEEKNKNTELKKEQDSLKTAAAELRKSKQALEQDVAKKEIANKKLQENANLKSYQRVSNDLAAAQIKLMTSKVAYKYEALEKAFKELSYELDLLAKLDPHVHGEYLNMLDNFLTKALRGRMKH
jgi:flagellar biosynthesis GTPase FlhF